MVKRKQSGTGPRVLIAGESWVTHSIHQKGFDSFTTTEYAEGVGWLRAALEAGGCEVDYQPAHIAARDFPATAGALSGYGCVILSDIGANTLLLHPDTFVRSRPLPNRLDAIRDYVRRGGGLVMVGGYLSFQGIDAKARYQGTPIEEALPVEIDGHDDRVEVPEGVEPRVVHGAHPIVRRIKGKWPALLGYNRVASKPDADVVVVAANDPLLVAGAFGKGRSVAFTSDCGPHWAPPAFVSWPGYTTLWQEIVRWTAGRS
ncbi:MAG: glutamine amidotransferase [Bauldia sp.]|nr:glutamine amidotransferase [Bauldia sp.]